ncbi:MAG: fibrobacter succinogenes major paralogous domain-containing protein [Bacteroidales bacterium]|nr:fibrobacter succinogenes major paralogous domain-containing protein [Bacteroidales bacterium]
MKKIACIFGLLVLAALYFVKAQDTLYIYQSGMVTEKSAISEIDSIAFSLGPLILGKISDIEGNEYLTVQIGTQTWMAENLRTQTFNDGTPIPKVTGNTAWAELTTPAWCWYNNDSAANASLYGPLYNWFAAIDSNLCPSGWHMPSVSEWNVLRDYLIANGYNYDGSTTLNHIGKSMASASNWNLSTGKGDVGNTDYPEYRNKSGFSVLPGGHRSTIGFSYIGDRSYFWSSTETDPGSMNAWFRYINYQDVIFNYSHINKKLGMSVRCVKN